MELIGLGRWNLGRLPPGRKIFFKSQSPLTEQQMKKHPSSCGGLCWCKWGLTMKRRRRRRKKKQKWAAELSAKRDGLTKRPLHTMKSYTAAKVMAPNLPLESHWVLLNKFVLKLEDKRALNQRSSSWVSFRFMLFSYKSWHLMWITSRWTLKTGPTNL